MKLSYLHRVAVGSLVAGLGLGSMALAAGRASSASARGAKSGSAAAAAAAPAPSAPSQAKAPAEKPKGPQVIENAANKFKITLPGTWTTFETGSPDHATGVQLGASIPPDRATVLASGSSNPNKPTIMYSDDMMIAVHALMDPASKADVAIEAVRAEIKADDAAAVFKPLEKAKVAGQDALVLTATLASEHADEPKRLERHVVFVRNGSRFDAVLKSHQNSFGKSSAAFQTALHSLQFTAPPDAPEALTKVYDNAEHKLSISAPRTWATGVPCHELACGGSFFAFVIPSDRTFGPHTKPEDINALHSEAVTLSVSPARDPKATLDAVAEDLKAEVKAADPKAEFKPLEKAKVADADAVVLTALTAGDAKDKEPQRYQRRVVTMRDGKVYQIIHFAHVDSAEKQTAVVENIVSSFQFTAAAAAAATATPAAPGAPAAAVAKPAAASDGLD